MAKKIISLLLVLVMSMTLMTNLCFAEEKAQETVIADGHEVQIKTEAPAITASCKEGNTEYKLEFNYDTGEFTLLVDEEKPWYSILSSKDDFEKKYDVNVDKATDDGKVKAKIIDDKGAVVEEIDQTVDQVSIQAPAIAIGGIGAALIAALIEAGKIAVVGGLGWVVASEIATIKAKNKKYYYYKAMIHSDGKVYFRQSLDKNAAVRCLRTKINVMATTAAKAKAAAQSASPIRVAQYDSAHKKVCGYRKHYHPVVNKAKNKDGKYKNRLKAHCFY